MNNYFKIFLTVVIVVMVGSFMTVGYDLLRMSDTAMNIVGVLIIAGTALSAYWALDRMWIKPIPKNSKIEFKKRRDKEEKRPDGERPSSVEDKKE